MGFASAITVVVMTIAAALAPAEDVNICDWAAKNIIVPDGPYAGQYYDVNHTPYAREILECMDPSHPCNRVAVMKPVQSGLSLCLMIACGFGIIQEPANMLLVFPDDGNIKKFNKQKLQPIIDKSPALRNVIRDQKSGVSGGSKAMEKTFPGGFLTLTGANSPASLSSQTIKRDFRDEVDRWPLEVGKDGCPHKLVDGRHASFEMMGDWKSIEISTPTITQISRIYKSYLAGDQREYYTPCPHCGHEFVMKFEPDLFFFETEKPYKPYFLCPSGNGCVIEEFHRRGMVKNGKWVPGLPNEGRERSYAFNSFITPFTPWGNIVQDFLDSKDNPREFKGFTNLRLGLPFEEKGDAPEWKKLFAKRENYKLKSIPAGGLFVTAASDVQQDGIYYEVVAWGAGGKSWSIDYGFLTGDPTDADNEVWTKLSDVAARRYPDSYGNAWGIEVFACDSGWASHNVYRWVRSDPIRRRAVKGDTGGWHSPAISRKPSLKDVDYDGRVVKEGVELWYIGTWSLKSEFYANLRKEGIRDGKELNPPGYCHFCEAHEQRFFKQITAEYIKKTTNKHGNEVLEWKQSGENHWLDCRVYNMAMADHLGINVMTVDDWQALIKKRDVPPDQGDMFIQSVRVASGTVPDPVVEDKQTEKEEETPPTKDSDDWLGDIRDDWIN